MFASDDTIVAVATPAGRGGIGVVRLSGADVVAIVFRLLDRSAPLVDRMATLARLAQAPDAPPGDEVIATWFAAPRSYTGEHVVEISAHGSPVILNAIVERAVAAGARLAEPGEFTLRAFLHGKRDLIQSEAVADLIEAVTPLQARIAFDQLNGTLTGRIRAIDATLFALIARLEASLDFPDEGYHFVDVDDVSRLIDEVSRAIKTLLGDARRGRLIREGATVVIAGRTNVGKSTLFNALIGADRAIVTDVPGTTRDLVTERIDIEGIPVTLVDTAGSRLTTDVVEQAGVSRAAEARRVADLVVVVLDATRAIDEDDQAILNDTARGAHVIAMNKSDLDGESGRASGVEDALHISARSGAGLGNLRRAIARQLCGGEAMRESAAISNVRHVALLDTACQHLDAAIDACARAATEEFVLTDLQSARACLDEVVGRRTSDDVLRHIFENFCIGK